ncbi:MAG: cupin domain-containing protein [Anaerolineales bacterium]
MSPSDMSLGERIKTLRLERDLSLRAVSRLSGVSFNALSRIERNLASPSVSTLNKIADALNVPLTAFFQVCAQEEEIIFCKHDKRVKLPFLRGMWESLAHNHQSTRIEPFLLTLEAGGGSGRFMMLHSGGEFVFCLEGMIEYDIEGERYLLEAGDSLIFLARRKHRWRNAGTGRSKALIVLFDHLRDVGQNDSVFITDTFDEESQDQWE